MSVENIDITPTPRILRTLGEIPFHPWQCIAELIDNAIDAFADSQRAGKVLKEKRITVSWSSESVALADRALEISDTALGMSMQQLQNAARAGFSSNDPVNNLGLFGMGFNIATARMGERTQLLSTQSGSSQWEGIEIDFPSLIQSGSFSAPALSLPKTDSVDHGTRIIISRLRNGAFQQLRDMETQIRRQLEVIYTPLLSNIDVEIYVQGKRLVQRPHCVWGKSRYVTRDGTNIQAVIEIDRDLGSALFDVDRNSYISIDEESKHRASIECGSPLPNNIIERHKRLTGWVGIQRYSDPNDFGIDFIRNGRKILIGNKSLFSYDNPLTGTAILQYPVELGSTVGGRIVGEIVVDYLLPTYQKNDFDKTDKSWLDTVEILRGIGPLLPNQRKAMSFIDPNTSPIGLLANAYRRSEPGTKWLFVDRTTARDFSERFRRGEAAYQTDEKWWEAAQEADRLRASGGAGISPEVDAGSTPSDTVDDYGPITPPVGVGTAVSFAPTPQIVAPIITPPPTSTLDHLLSSSSQMISWSGAYNYGHAQPLHIKVWELKTGQILQRGESTPCAFFADGVECDFIFNPRHPFLSQFPIGPRELLGLYIAEKLKARDSLKDIGKLYSEILQTKLQDVRVDRTGLQEKASGMFDQLREKLFKALEHKVLEVLDCIHQSSGETEETINAMLSSGGLVLDFQNKDPKGMAALLYVPHRTLIRIVSKFPEDLFDGKVFSAPYIGISLSDVQATQRSREESKDRIIAFIKDALWVLSPSSSGVSGGKAKDELARCSHSISFLSRELGD